MSRNQSESGAESTHSKPTSSSVQADWPLNIDFLPQNRGSSDGRDTITISSQWFKNWYLERATEHNKLRQLLIESHTILISSMNNTGGDLSPNKKTELESRIRELDTEKDHYHRKLQELEKIKADQEKYFLKKIDNLENQNEILEAKLSDILSGAKFYEDERKQWFDSDAGRMATRSPHHPVVRLPLQPVERPPNKPIIVPTLSKVIGVTAQPAERPRPMSRAMEVQTEPASKPVAVPTQPSGRTPSKPVGAPTQPAERPISRAIGASAEPAERGGLFSRSSGVASQPVERPLSRAFVQPQSPVAVRPLGNTSNDNTEAIQNIWLRKPESSPTPIPARSSTAGRILPVQPRTRSPSGSVQTPQPATEEHKRPEPAKLPVVIKTKVHVYHGESSPTEINRWFQAIEEEVANNETTIIGAGRRRIDDKYIEMARLHMDGVSVYPWFTRMCLNSGVKDLRRPVLGYPFNWATFQAVLRHQFEEKNDI
ncbi:hypothetical protein K440DRAFT_661647 [Wilcoxina mikolae CBS 423.85]|nr:hypothetical protein K440DRAFT_661647 [Wilcoxina mikolae CBS 423.85]